VDRTFPTVTIALGNSENTREITVGESEAVHYMIAQVLGVELKYIECPFCTHPHLDRGWFSVHPHTSHLCAACGRDFLEPLEGIGNPLIKVKKELGDEAILRETIFPNRCLKISQHEYPFGIELWGSNQAIVWTAEKPEEQGIHVHCYARDHLIPSIDETFDSVVIDDRPIDGEQLRVLMAQRALPYLQGKVQALDCPKCGSPHFDTGKRAYEPHSLHDCLDCRVSYRVPATNR